jgi:outer membrane protein OmpA-like peptidoglycan-associated protein
MPFGGDRRRPRWRSHVGPVRVRLSTDACGARLLRGRVPLGVGRNHAGRCPPKRSRRAGVGLALALTFLAGVACSPSDRLDDQEPLTASPGLRPTQDPGPGEPAAAASGELEPDPLCVGRPGVEVERLPDVSIPAVEIPAATDRGTGEVVVPARVIPEQTAYAGCIVRHEAPGGCLGAVDVSWAEIPAVTIPAAQLGRRNYPAVTIPAIRQEGVHADEVCQIAQDDGLPTVTRLGVVREGFSRPGAARPGDDLVPTVRLEAVSLPDVDLDPERLTRQELTGEVSQLRGDERTSYMAPASVLFDTDSAELRPGADRALTEIAGRIKAGTPGVHVLVEGHTDDRGDDTYGLELSRRRAQTVAQWLVDAGLERSSLRTRGWGEERPAYPNDSAAHRQANRRVVITVLG